MDPIQSWLDAKEVRRMAESLMAPAPEVDQAALDAGYGDDFEGFAGAKMEHSQVAATASPAETTSSAPPLDQPTQLDLDDQKHQDVGTTAKIVVSHALADARRLAEGSGMLSSPAGEFEQTAAANLEDAALNPATIQQKPEHQIAAGSHVVSPFQVSEDQTPGDDIPIAQQVSPPSLSQPAAPPAMINPDSIQGAEIDTNSSAKVILPPSPQKSGPPVSGGARGPFLTRLKKFSVLLREHTGAKAMFLIDNEGQILIDEVNNSKLIQVARTLANASHTATRQTAGAADVGNLHVKIGASATLEVIPCRSRYGLLILGVVCPAPMGTDRVKQVADYLAKTVEPGGKL